MEINRVSKVKLICGSNTVVFDGKITSMPLDENLIIKKSIEFFSDDSPCFIHRSAVMKRLFMELESFLDIKKSQGCTEMSLSQVPDSIGAIISCAWQVEKIQFI